ncbi:MAG: DUF839 domain-containing protein [Luteitalea sp.]|nr:DUF839 domain-containing protein [Luteitalea sp.]
MSTGVHEPLLRLGETFEEVMARRVGRRSFIKGAAAAAPLLVVAPTALAEPSGADTATRPLGGSNGLTFKTIPLQSGEQVVVPPGYRAAVVARWGDPLHDGVPTFDPLGQTPIQQAQQVGYNCDFLMFFPLPPEHRGRRGRFGVGWRRRGLLTVNHEYTNPELMFEGYNPESPLEEQVNIELMAHGLSVLEVIESRETGWEVRRGSPFNRRITAATPILLGGPVAGDAMVKTSGDPNGRLAFGTLNNCGGGITPWQTLLTAEENFNQYFANNNALPESDPRRAFHERYGIPGDASARRWELFHDRFDVSKEPNEPFRFGYIVEIDPFDPHSFPTKRTALGRMKHEAATVALSRSRRAVVYSGDDERFEHIYKFVSAKPVSHVRGHNRDLLDEGILYAAKFNDDGTGAWIPLIAGQGALADWTQAEVCINTREAALVSGATRMDRPEDGETNPRSGKVYFALTNNTARTTPSGDAGEDAANPRQPNPHGHILEITEQDDDHAATSFTWEVFILCGDPDEPADGTYFAGFDQSNVSAISSPDNITFDRRGNLWIATDGQASTFGANDGIYAVPTDGRGRGFLRQFLSGVMGAEVASLVLAPDQRTLFVSIQHPGEGSTLSDPTGPSTRWPDFGAGPPRPSVVAVWRERPPFHIGA